MNLNKTTAQQRLMRSSISDSILLNTKPKTGKGCEWEEMSDRLFNENKEVLLFSLEAKKAGETVTSPFLKSPSLRHSMLKSRTFSGTEERDVLQESHTLRRSFTQLSLSR